jgi:hypothetical protein
VRQDCDNTLHAATPHWVRSVPKRYHSDLKHLTWNCTSRLLNYVGVENLYNGLGQRVSQTMSSVVTEYLPSERQFAV